MRYLHKSRNALRMFRRSCAVKNIVGQEQGFGVLAELIEDAFSPCLRGLTYKERVDFQAAANRFFDQADSFNRTKAIVRRPLREGFAQLFHQRVLPTGDWTQSLPALGGHWHGLKSLYSARVRRSG